MKDVARIIRTGDEQSVELPEAYRFDTAEVRISRDGDRVVLEPARAVDDDEIDPDTGRTIGWLRAFIQAGIDSGPSEPLDIQKIKRDARAQWDASR